MDNTRERYEGSREAAISLSNRMVGRLVCPLSHEPLRLVEITGVPYLQTAASGTRYTIVDRIPRLIPREPPDALRGRWRQWQQLQENGLYSYVTLPSINTSQNEAEARQVIEFFRLSDPVLDIGCGPLRERSAYARWIDVDDYVGLDPLAGLQPKDFQFVQAIGELLPFADDTFGSLIFYSSLDHVIALELVLAEAKRVLRPGGFINVWMDQEQPEPGLAHGLWHQLTRGSRQLLAARRDLGLRGAAAYGYRVATMRIPRGARDQFHMDFPAPDRVVEKLRELGFDDMQRLEMGAEVALSLRLGQ